jgi:hypothetical protein
MKKLSSYITILIVGLVLGIGLSNIPSVTANAFDSSEYQYSQFNYTEAGASVFVGTATFPPGLTRKQMIGIAERASAPPPMEKPGGVKAVIIGKGAATSNDAVTSANGFFYRGYTTWDNLPMGYP